MGYLFVDDHSNLSKEEINEVFWIFAKVCIGTIICCYTLKWLVKYCKKKSAKVEEETLDPLQELELIAETLRKVVEKAEKPPSYDLATEENLPPPKYEEIVIQK